MLNPMKVLLSFLPNMLLQLWHLHLQISSRKLLMDQHLMGQHCLRHCLPSKLLYALILIDTGIVGLTMFYPD